VAYHRSVELVGNGKNSDLKKQTEVIFSFFVKNIYIQSVKLFFSKDSKRANSVAHKQLLPLSPKRNQSRKDKFCQIKTAA